MVDNIVKKEIKKTPKIAIMTLFLLVTLLISLIEAIIRSNWSLMILTIVVAMLICLPRFIGKWSNITIPKKLETYVILFIYASLFLGELRNYYATYWWWDVALHTSSGLAFGIIGFFIMYVLYKIEKIKTNPKTIAMFAFAFALAIGALWEIVEFSIDSIFGPVSNGVLMQTVVNGCGLADTMKDLIVDSIGALVAAFFGYLYIKKESAIATGVASGSVTNAVVGVVVQPTMKEFKKDNPRLFKKKKKVKN